MRGPSSRLFRSCHVVRLAFLSVLFVCGGFGASPFLFATSVIPISDAELYRRADVILHGVVVSSDTIEDAAGRPETISVVEPLAVLKGELSGNLVLHQLGGRLPDGRFFELPGRPEYVPGREVIVFAIGRPQGDYQTAEMMLGKFEVWQDEKENLFAVPALAKGVYPGVTVYHRPGDLDEGATQPRVLSGFLEFLRSGGRRADVTGTPVGKLSPVLHPEKANKKAPLWGNIGDTLWRWNNPAADAWTLDGQANMDGGGVAEATNAVATWTDDPTSVINYTIGSGNDLIHLDAMSSPCGWSTCLQGSGVIGCGGPGGGGSNTWRGESYITITNGEVWLRSFCTHNEFSSTIVQSVITHELGHTLGLGHSDQNVSSHDVCRGDEDAATMRSYVQDRTTLGTDDIDAIRWIYGDSGNSCSTLPPPSISSINPVSGTSGGGTSVTINGANFQYGTAVTIGGTPATVSGVPDTTISATTGFAVAPGVSDVVVTNPDGQAATLAKGYFYDFLDVPSSHPFYSYVVKIAKNGITAGCGGDNYCPEASVTRAQMSVFLLKGKHGSAYTPPACAGLFGDVSCPSAFAVNWIEELYNEAITAGCGSGNYCPDDAVTRAQMAVFLLRGKHGSAYNPPACKGIFGDVTCPTAFAVNWIEELYNEGITGGCLGGNYCPDDPTTRGQMAVFLTVTFNLP